jgi:hypothetical protein
LYDEAIQQVYNVLQGVEEVDSDMISLILTGIKIATKQCLSLIGMCINKDVNTISQLATKDVVDSVMLNITGEHKVLALHALGQILCTENDEVLMRVFNNDYYTKASFLLSDADEQVVYLCLWGLSNILLTEFYIKEWLKTDLVEKVLVIMSNCKALL